MVLMRPVTRAVNAALARFAHCYFLCSMKKQPTNPMRTPNRNLIQPDVTWIDECAAVSSIALCTLCLHCGSATPTRAPASLELHCLRVDVSLLSAYRPEFELAALQEYFTAASAFPPFWLAPPSHLGLLPPLQWLLVDV